MCQTTLDTSNCTPYCSVVYGNVANVPCVVGFGVETDKDLKPACKKKFKPFLADSGVCLPKCKKDEVPLLITGDMVVEGVRYTNFTRFDECQLI